MGCPPPRHPYHLQVEQGGSALSRLGTQRTPAGLGLDRVGASCYCQCPVAGFQKKHPALPCRGKFLPKTPQLSSDRMHIKTILNRIEKQPGFIYDTCRWRDSGPRALVITLRPQAGSKPICSKCGERRPGYDTLRVRSLLLSHYGPYQSFSSTLHGGCSVQPVGPKSKSCHGLWKKAILQSLTPGFWPPGASD